MELIFNKQYFEDTMKVLDYDAEKLPLGRLSKRTLETGFDKLKTIGQLLAAPSNDSGRGQAIQQASNAYYTTIPHNFGMRRPQSLTPWRHCRRRSSLWSP